MSVQFRNYWGTKVFMLIMFETMFIHTTQRGRWTTYIGLLNFCIIIIGKIRKNV